MNYTWVLYDASCPFCTASVHAFKKTLEKRNCRIKPLQDDTIMKILDIKNDENFPEMKVIGNNLKVYGGARAIIHVSEKIWWAKPIWALSHLPLVMNVLDYIYKFVAERRHCHGFCDV